MDPVGLHALVGRAPPADGLPLVAVVDGDGGDPRQRRDARGLVGADRGVGEVFGVDDLADEIAERWVDLAAVLNAYPRRPTSIGYERRRRRRCRVRRR
ncbi:hypothetical protein PM023_09130 [Halorubrum ezzemoulense]|uniref:hypothetical protein n=1 Tax=Halorubrum ezzemoulense TaxID=337243 RepID=UPI002330DA87|nr:hypothetical protein [Halorubrum ezzemoulense]MDB2224829.1 hypothetical protein [Halorubrum ezzemoulense]